MENQLTLIPPLADAGSSRATPRHCALFKKNDALVSQMARKPADERDFMTVSGFPAFVFRIDSAWAGKKGGASGLAAG